MPPRPRVPTREEADLLRVYLDAERSLLGAVRDEVAGVADVPEHLIASREAQGARALRDVVERTVRGLDRGAPARVEAIIGAAAESGVDEAARALSGLTGAAAGFGEQSGPVNRRALDRLAATVVSAMGQAHAAILRTVPDAFRTAVARSVPGVLVGAETRREAAQRAMWALTDQGITGFTDRSGRRWRLSSYVEMATRTAAARAHVDAQLDGLSAAGREFVRVSDAPRECPKCRPWEGEVLAIGDGPTGSVEAEHAIEDGRMVTIHVAGTVDEARRAGLLHPGCRHSLSLYLPGVTRAEVPRAQRQDPDGYNAGQRQREIERNIRAWKERQAAAIDPAAAKYAAAHVRSWQARMRDHLQANPDLKRLRYREAPGAGNVPTTGLRERVGPTGPAPALVKTAERQPRHMVDAELERRMQRALADEQFDEFERFAAETDRRDAAKEARRRRDAAARERAEAEKAERFDALMSAGVDEESAVEDVYGVSIERQRRQRAISQLRANGYDGKGFDDLARAAFRDEVWQRYQHAEELTNGFLTTRDAFARKVDALSLFTGPEHVARANASPELLEYWDQYGRPTLDEFKAELLGDGGAARAMRGGRGDFLT